jgi:hypothetical protein
VAVLLARGGPGLTAFGLWRLTVGKLPGRPLGFRQGSLAALGCRRCVVGLLNR